MFCSVRHEAFTMRKGTNNENIAKIRIPFIRFQHPPKTEKSSGTNEHQIWFCFHPVLIKRETLKTNMVYLWQELAERYTDNMFLLQDTRLGTGFVSFLPQQRVLTGGDRRVCTEQRESSQSSQELLGLCLPSLCTENIVRRGWRRL